MRESTKGWIAQRLSIDGEGVDWVSDPKFLIKKENFTFASMFFWTLVRQHLSPMTLDNILTCDRAVLVEALVDGLKVDFARLMISVIYEGDFMARTIYPFSCMIFLLCRDARVSILNIDVFRTPTRIVYINLIREEANVAAPQRGPRLDMQLLGENLADTIEKTQGDNHATSEPTIATPVESAPCMSVVPSSSRSTTSSTSGPDCYGLEVRGQNGHLAALYLALDAEVHFRG